MRTAATKTATIATAITPATCTIHRPPHCLAFCTASPAPPLGPLRARRRTFPITRAGGIPLLRERLQLVRTATLGVVRFSLFGVAIITVVYIPVFAPARRALPVLYESVHCRRRTVPSA